MKRKFNFKPFIPIFIAKETLINASCINQRFPKVQEEKR